MANVKKFEDFVKESTVNKGKGIDGDTDLFPRPTPKQTINRGDLNPIDNLGIQGHQITTDKIDGIIKSVKDGIVYVEDRLTKEIKEYSVTEFLKEFHKSYQKEKKAESEKSYESIVVEPEPELDEQDKEILGKILKVNENSSEKQLWEKKWESFAKNYVKSVKEVDEDFEEFAAIEESKNEEEKLEDYLKESNFEEEQSISLESLSEPVVEETTEEPEKVKIESFENFINSRLKIKPDSIDEDINKEDEDNEETIGIAENTVPKSVSQVECSDCGEKVDDEEFDKVRHLYSKHNFKATTNSNNDLTKWLLQYFPPEVPEKKKK